MLLFLSRFGFVALVLAALTIPSLPAHIFAQEAPSWTTPAVQKGEDFDYSQYNHLYRNQIGGNFDYGCAAFSDGTPSCLPSPEVEHILGDGGSSQNYRLLHSDMGGTQQHTRVFAYPTKNPDVLMVITIGPTTSNKPLMSLRKGSALQSIIAPSTDGGSPFITWVNPASFELRNANGENYVFQDDIFDRQMTYSRNGDWLAFWADNSFTRINLVSFEVTTYQTAPDVLQDMSYAAISDNGRYFAFSLFNEPLRLLDTVTCGRPDLSYVQLPGAGETCDTLNFGPFLAAYEPGPTLGLIPYFYNNSLLGFIVQGRPGTAPYIEYLFRPSIPNTPDPEPEPEPETPARISYLALGDSFSSGEGTGNYIDGTDKVGINMCHTSYDSYPYVISRQLDIPEFKTVACSGAVINDYWIENQQKNEDTTSGRPGSLPQKEFLFNKRPQIVTITMSGNDINFADRLRYCILQDSDCYSTRQSRRQIADEIGAQYQRLIDLYTDVLHDDSVERLYVIGYPSIVGDAMEMQCGINVQLNTYQRLLAQDLLEYLNDVVEAAAKTAGAFYVDAEKVLSGHRLCETGPDKIAVNGITAGNDGGIWKLKFINNDSYHPNARGQDMLAQRILLATDSLMMPMPAPQATPLPNAVNYALMKNTVEDNSMIRRLVHNPSGESLIERGRSFLIDLVTPDFPLAPNSIFNIWLHSDPTNLGELQTDTSGRLQAEITMPESVKPGMHELHIQGNDLNGAPIDVYWFVYVAASATDFDDDGIANEDEPCGILDPSGVDADKDGIDDACDGEIILDESNNESPGGTPVPALTVNITSKAKPQILGMLTKQQEPASGSNNTPQAQDTSDTTDTIPENKTPESNNSTGPALAWTVAAITLMLVLGYSVFRYARNHRQAS